MRSFTSMIIDKPVYGIYVDGRLVSITEEPLEYASKDVSIVDLTTLIRK